MLITTKKDFFLLKQICEYNILTVDQLALINNSGRRIIQKKIAKFSKYYLVNLKQSYSSSNYGRPENIISIDEKGVMTCPPKSDPVCILGSKGEKIWEGLNLQQNKS